MQLDFLSRLTAWVRKDLPVERTIPAAAPAEDAGLTTQARELVRALGCAALAERVTVRWNSRMRSTAGLANYAKALVILNPKLADFGSAEIDQTFRHELAHLVARERAGRRRIAPHGAEWKRACRDLGIAEEKRCHNLPLPRRQIRRKHLYRCPDCQTEIRRVRPFRTRVACLSCCRKHSNGRFDERFRLVKVRDEREPVEIVA
ncbi:MAG: SprT-like domain-containing protein [Verrucomicrobiota bacterium]